YQIAVIKIHLVFVESQHQSGDRNPETYRKLLHTCQKAVASARLFITEVGKGNGVHRGHLYGGKSSVSYHQQNVINQWCLFFHKTEYKDNCRQKKCVTHQNFPVAKSIDDTNNPRLYCNCSQGRGEEHHTGF